MNPLRAISNPSDLVAHVASQFRGAEVEHFYVIVLDILNRPIHTVCVGKGAIDSCVVDMREIFRPVIIERGSGFIVAHNHPSGSTKPSAADLRLTENITKAARIIGVPLLDHIIIPTGKYAQNGDYLSMAEQGLL
jgi:DNA repair protein RadC